MTDFDSTMALLSSDIPDIEVPNYPRPAGGDSDEEEVFFGPHRSDKEKHGKNSIEYLRRVTLKPGEVQPKITSYRGDPNNRSIPEEDEDDKENKTVPAISPSKQNAGKGPTFNSVLKTPKFAELKSSVDDDDDDSRTSFVDVENDQMFDCSLFTEYDDRDLSCMSENIVNKWRSRLTKEQSKKLQKSRSEQSHAKVMTLTKEDKKQISIANETMDLLDEFDVLESDSVVDVDKVKKNLNFDETKRNEEEDEEEKIPDEILNLPTNQKSVEVESKPKTEEDDVQSDFKEPVLRQNRNEVEDRLNLSIASSTGSRRRSSTNSTCSDWFNTTREEMILYEKFGEDYDLVVEKMSHQEKVKLKEEIANAVPKDVRELLGDQMTNEDEICDQDRELDDIVEEEENLPSDTSKVSHQGASRHSSSSNRSRIPVRNVIKTDDLDITKAFAALEAAQSTDLDVTKAFAALEVTRVGDNDVSKVFASLEASQSSVHDVSKSSISRVEETPDVSQLSDRIMPKLQHQQQLSDIRFDENEFQQRRPPVPLPRTLTPQKSREVPVAVEKEVERPYTPVKNLQAPTPEKETKVDKRAGHTPAKDHLATVPEKETKVDKRAGYTLAKDHLATVPEKETKVEKRGVYTPAKDFLAPSSEKDTKVPKRFFTTPGIETNVDNEGFVEPPAASDPRPSGGRRRFFKTPEALKTPSYLKPTSASKNRASPRKIDPGSPSASPQSQQCNRGNYCGASPFMNPWQPSPSSASKHHRGYPAIDMTKIVSPVAQYIHNSNVPKLMRNIRPKVTNNLEQELLALQEFEAKEKELMEQEEEDQSNRQQPKKRYFKPLPEAEYRSSRVALEKEVASEEPKDLPKKFWTTSSTEAVVVRHLARERVGQQEIRNWPSSPDGGRAEQIAGGAVLVRSTAPPRDSDCFNETSMEMSIREVKKIKKLTPSVSKRYLN